MSSSTKSRNFRRRGEEYDDNNDASTNVHSSAASRKPSSSSSSSKPKKLLSFADDEDDDTPSSRISSSKSSSSSQKPSSRLTKPSSSHKLTVSKDRLPPTPSSTTSNVLPQAGIYTKEALLELQKNTRTLAKPTSSALKTPSSSTSEPKIILKGLLKPTQEDPVAQTLKQSQQLDSEEDDQQPEGSDRNDAENRFASLGLGKSNDYSLIPDEETIKKIRARRERMRQSRAAAPDYISLDGGPSHGAAEGLSDEEPEFRTRIAMIGKKETSSSGHGVFEDFDNDGDDNGRIKGMTGITAARYHNNQVTMEEGTGGVDDEDEEDKIWEEEQFRKGLGKRMDDVSGTNRVFTSSTTALLQNQQPQQQQQQRPVMYGSVPSIGGSSVASQGSDALSIPQQAEIARKALQDNVRRLKVL